MTGLLTANRVQAWDTTPIEYLAFAFSGVEISLSDANGALVGKKTTGKGGYGEFGPLEGSAGDYSMSLAKMGYEFEALESSNDNTLLYAAKELLKV